MKPEFVIKVLRASLKILSWVAQATCLCRRATSPAEERRLRLPSGRWLSRGCPFPFRWAGCPAAQAGSPCYPFLRLALSVGAMLAYAASAFAQATSADAAVAKIEFFEKKVRPILVENCYSCHSADTKPAGGLRVDDRNGLLSGGDGGAAVVPGEPEISTLLRRLRAKDVKRRMPKDTEALSEEQIATLETWIKDGAAWPRERIPASLGRIKPEYGQLRTNHWAWQPLTVPKVPSVAKTAWPRSDIDRFILAKLEEKNLPPVGDADRITLIRRVTFDLTGLPPAPEDIQAFPDDKSKDAFAKVVDRLLASPQFGERWGRHWLDVARYAESTGPSRNIPYPHAWKYRDYVIDAVNKDVPFDRFIEEQVAGDLLPAKTTEERDRLSTATGFLAIGAKDVNQRFKVRFLMDNVDEQIDAVTRSVLGVTVSCARCHDHKFDPIPTTDYYAMAGIFTSTDHAAGVRNKMGGGGLDYYDPAMLVKLSAENFTQAPKEKVEKLQAEVAEAKKAWDAIRGTPEGLARGSNGQPKQRPFRLKYERLQAEVLGLTDPVTQGYAVHGVRDAKTIADTEVRIRGQAERLGPTAPRGFLTAFTFPNAPEIKGTNSSGRLELAQWLTSPKNPLTARVVVNRIWAHLFGDGIVTTVDNFGVNGDVPSHPELLDYLANEFMRNGWSTKKLVREILLSHAYQLGSEAPETHRKVDPANRFVWRHSPRRLAAEEIRDAMLASSGQLQPKPPGGSAAKELKMIEMRDNGREAHTIHENADCALYRSVYLPALRGVVSKALEAFDPVEQSLVTGKRETTTVPTQSLYLLNSGFVRQQSLALAERLLTQSHHPDVERIQQAYLLTLGRDATKQEVKRAQEFLTTFESSYRDTAPAQPTVHVAAVTPKEDDAKTDATVVNPDDIDRTDEVIPEQSVQAKDARTAAWLSFSQALYASAEFRFVR